MPEDDARAIMRGAGLEPQQPYPGSNRPWLCRHTCGRLVSPSLSNARLGRGICRYCNSDFPFDGPALVYLVADHDAMKIGICAPHANRVYDHTRYGWSLIWTVALPTGDDAYALEQAVVAWWRHELKVLPVYRAEQMPQTGHTETAPWLEDMNPSLVLGKVDAVAHDLGIQMLGASVTWHEEARPSARSSPYGVRVRARQRDLHPVQPPLWD